MAYPYYPTLQQPYTPMQPQIPTMPQPQPVPMPTMPQPVPQNTEDRIFVSGIQEADSWVVQRGQSARLWDRNGNTFYIKSVSESGMPLPLEIYDYKRRNVEVEAPAPTFDPSEYVKRDEFEELKKLVKPERRTKKDEPTD